MSARGIGAFIQGGFQGYQFGESIKDNKAQRARQTELDRIAEEQRVRQNRREDVRDTYLASDQAYVESERDRAGRERAELDAIDARTIAHVDEYRAARGVSSTIPSVIAPPASSAPITGGADDSAVVGDAGQDQISRPRMFRAPPLTSERAAQLQSIGQLVAPARGALPMSSGVGISSPEARYLADRGQLLPPAANQAAPAAQAAQDRLQRGVMPSDIQDMYNRSFRDQGPAGQAVPNNVPPTPPPAEIVANLPTAARIGFETESPFALADRGGPLLPPQAEQAAPIAQPPIRPPTASHPPATPVRTRGVGPAGGPVPAATRALDAVGTPATKALAKTIAADPPTEKPGTPAAEREAADTARTWLDDYMAVGLEFRAEEMVRAGLITEAREYITWAQEAEVQQGMEAYGQAAIAAANNDFEAFGSAIVEIYNSESYFPDGFTIVQDQSGFITDENGQVAGARVTLADEQGVETVQYWENVDDLMQTIMIMVAPENAFAQRLVRQTAAADAQASEAQRQIELEDYFAREIFKDSLNDDSRERVVEAQKVLASDLTLQFSQKSPEEQLALMANYLAQQDQLTAQQDQLTAQLRGGGPAAGTPAAPPAVLRR